MSECPTPSEPDWWDVDYGYDEERRDRWFFTNHARAARFSLPGDMVNDDVLAIEGALNRLPVAAPPDVLRAAAQEAVDAYDYRVRNGLAPMGRIDSMEGLRGALAASRREGDRDGD